MPYVEVPGAQLNIADAGRIEAPTLLFVHGNVMDLRMWDALVGSLESEFRCVRWDLRLHGATVDNRESFSYWDAARDGMAVLDRLGLPAATWVGHSQGGFTALRAALLAPDRVGTIPHSALVIHGRRDIPIPFDGGEELARALPGSGPIAGIDAAGIRRRSATQGTLWKLSPAS
jgi:pimeloyl-ACP methyl ester carboxylesterase